MTLGQYSKQGFKEKAWLYSFVFLGRWSILITLFLVCSLLFQPMNQAFAEESEAAPTASDVIPQEIANEDSEENDENEIENEVQELNVVSETESSEEDELNLSVEDEEGVPSEIEETELLTEEVELVFSESESNDANEKERVDEAEEPVLTPELIDPEQSNVKTLEEIQDEVEKELVDEETPVTLETDYVITDENFFQFDRQSWCSG